LAHNIPNAFYFITKKIKAMNPVKILVAAVVATAVMSIILIIAAHVGLPSMNAGVLLGTLFGGSQALGWIAHFFMGILFALPYVFFFNRWLPVENKIARGAIYGILVFIVSQILFFAIDISGFLKWHAQENMALLVFGYAMVSMIYGSVLGVFFTREGYDALEDNKREYENRQAERHLVNRQ
jgi:hypothetical protein